MSGFMVTAQFLVKLKALQERPKAQPLVNFQRAGGQF
jgi:hypothetical protein